MASPGELNEPNCVIDIGDDEIPVGEFILVILVVLLIPLVIFIHLAFHRNSN